MNDISATVTVTREIAESFPQRPDRVAEAKRAAEQAMNETAAERGRRVSSEPALIDIDNHTLSDALLLLTFQARTRPA